MSAAQPIAKLSVGLLAVVVGISAAAADEGQPNDARARRFIHQYETTVRPLEIEVNRRWWTANITGKEEDFRSKQAAEEKLDLRLADPREFAELKAIKEGGVSDPLLARQIEVLYLAHLEKQLPPELLKRILARSNAIQRAFNLFRPRVGDQELTDNDVRRILLESRDSHQRRATWEASKKVGRVVLADLKKLVALRNQAARKLGFPDFYTLRLCVGEQNPQQLLKLFDELDQLTRAPFHQAKAEIDAALARDCGVSVAELRPWHYHDPFFQEAPAVLGDLPESIYKSLDIVALCRAFYGGIGLPVDDILDRSDLYEKPGKNPHAFSQDMDREGDVRILENVVPNREWLATTLHELGHAVYSKSVDTGRLPYVLRTDAHPLCTEGIAMMFERFAQNVDWLQAMGVKIPEAARFRAASARLQRNRLLVFARYAQVMFRFEMALYANPDQDLNRLWWDLVEKYQEIKCPEGRDEPDFAAKYHTIGAPAYYHNYMLGELFASQVHHALVRALGRGKEERAKGTEVVVEKPRSIVDASRRQPPPSPSGPVPFSAAGAIYVGNKAAGEFLERRVFAPGLTLDWNELTRHATGEEFNAKAFAEDLRIAD